VKRFKRIGRSRSGEKRNVKQTSIENTWKNQIRNFLGKPSRTSFKSQFCYRQYRVYRARS